MHPSRLGVIGAKPEQTIGPQLSLSAYPLGPGSKTGDSKHLGKSMKLCVALGPVGGAGGSPVRLVVARLGRKLLRDSEHMPGCCSFRNPPTMSF